MRVATQSGYNSPNQVTNWVTTFMARPDPENLEPPMDPVRHGDTLADTPENPNGIPASSPGLRGTSYPGATVQDKFQPRRGCVCRARAGMDTTPLGLEKIILLYIPRVARASQPWALGRSPVGAGDNTALSVFTR